MEKPTHDQADDAHEKSPPKSEPVWHFRGYELRPSEFTTAMVHLYRGELQRATAWRATCSARQWPWWQPRRWRCRSGD